jgi:signal transduction histidine kinase
MWFLHLGGTMRIIDIEHASWGRRGDTAAPERDLSPALDPSAPPARPLPSSWTEVPAGLVALLVCAPLTTLAGVAIEAATGTAYRIVLLGCLAQLVLVALVLRLRSDWSSGQAIGHEEAADVGSADLAARRDQDCLHEVRATVAGIGATHRLLRDRPERLSGATRTRLERLYDGEIARLERLLDDDRPDNDRVAVHAAVTPVVDSLRLQGLAVAWGGTSASALGRSDDVAEIVHILLDNAARHAPGAEASVQVDTTASTVLLRVSDTGPGIPQPLRRQLFDRGARRPGSPGEGIGLNIASRLAHEMGGDLVLEPSSRAGGASFTLVLRAASEAVPCLARRG